MPLSRQDIELLERLTKEFKIVFAGDVQPSNWPEFHKETLEHVTKLGKTEFNRYAVDPDIQSEKPWKARVKSLAEDLVETAKRCMGRNESSWRHACEPQIFARLSGDVVW
jgi:hypothetical protein